MTMITQEQIRCRINDLFPDFLVGREENIFHLHLGNFTAYLYTFAADKERFGEATERVASLLNELLASAEVDEGTKITLTEEILEFYAHTEERSRLITQYLLGESVDRMKTARETLEYWRNFKKQRPSG